MQPVVDNTMPARSAIEGAVYIPIDLLAPSLTNPRKHFDADQLGELASSIRAHGLISPILVRPRGVRHASGEQLYEIVTGERRWRASQLAEQPSVMAIVRELSDFDAREIQLIENLARTDLHPLEEAEGYEALLRKPDGLQGYATVDELAARIGKSRRYVANRLALCKLLPEAREAFHAGTLSTSNALLLAGIGAARQPQVLAEIVHGEGGEPWSYRQAAEHVQHYYMLPLGGARFDREDAKLVPAAGPCTLCPKRSGANPDLFDYVKSADVCTDPPCFEAKTRAHGAQLLAQATQAGVRVLTGAAARKVMPYSEHSLDGTGYLVLDKPAEALTGTRQNLSTLLGKDFTGGMLLQTDDQDLPINVATRADVIAALKANGVFKPSITPPGKKVRPLTGNNIEAQRGHRIADLLAERTPAHVWNKLRADGACGLPDISAEWLRLLATRLLMTSCVDIEIVRLVITQDAVRKGHDWLDELGADQLWRVIITELLSDAIAKERPSTPADIRQATDSLAHQIGVDLAALRAQVTAEVDRALADEIDALKAPLSKKKPAAKLTKNSDPLTPERALAASVASPRAKQPAKGNGAKTVKAAKKAPAAEAAVYITPEAAWPFPKAAP